MTRLIHIGDVHLQAGQARNQDRLVALDQIIAAGLAFDNLGAWLIPGDLFHTKSTITDRNDLAGRLIRMASRAPVCMVPGNHDAPGDLDIFAHLKGAHPIYVIDRPHCLRLKLATGEFATIFCLPYPQKAGLTSAGVAAGDVVETAGDLLEPIFMTAAEELETARANGDITLMIGHVNVAGSVMSNGQPNIGHEIELNPRHLDRLGNIPKLLNHIHKPQIVAGAHYAGSVCRLDYGETEAKRFIEVEIQRDGGNQEHRVASHPIDVAPMYHVDGELTRESFTYEIVGSDAPLNGAAIDWTGADVRVRYRYKASERAVLDVERVTREFIGARQLKVEGVAIPDRELRAPEVAAAITLEAKLAAYLKVDELSPALLEKLARLQSPDQDSALAAATAVIRAIEQDIAENLAVPA